LSVGYCQWPYYNALTSSNENAIVMKEMASGGYSANPGIKRGCLADAAAALALMARENKRITAKKLAAESG
jgi:hypothetical protein